jgi:stage V sporulation protein SpoVS
MPSEPGVHKPLVLPPGFNALPSPQPWQAALAAAAADAAPGTLLHAPLGGLLDAALILAPDRPLGDGTMLQLASMAVRDAVAAVIPPENTVTIAAPGVLAVNRGDVATIAVASGPVLPDGAPAWLVLGFTVRVALRLEAPGVTPWQTDLAEEGAETSAAALLEAICRHLLAGFDLLQDVGEAAVARAWQAA